MKDLGRRKKESERGRGKEIFEMTAKEKRGRGGGGAEGAGGISEGRWKKEERE